MGNSLVSLFVGRPEYQPLEQGSQASADQPRDDTPHSRYVTVCAAFSAIGGLLFGYDQGVVSIILVMPQFLKRFPSVDDSTTGAGLAKGILTAMILLGAFLGALSQGWIADRISRKRSISLASLVFVVGGSIQTAAFNYNMLAFGRFVGGIGIGMLAMVVPLYISEISPPNIRGTLLVLEEFSIVLGIVIAFYISYATRHIESEWSWRLPFLIQLIPGVILGFGIYLLPYSPRFLAGKERYAEGLSELAKLRNLSTSHPSLTREWLDIQAEAILRSRRFEERHPELKTSSPHSVKRELAAWADCFKPGCWRRTHVGTGVMFFQQMVGINAIIYYSPSLLRQLGLAYDMQLFVSGFLNVFQLIGVTTSLYTMDKWGRRTLLINGAVTMAVCHLVVAALVGTYSDSWPSHQVAAWVSVTALLVYMFVFGSSFGPVPWALPSEIFPESLRAKGVAISTCSNWFNNFIVGLITPELVIKTGYGAYVFFMVFCCLAAGWVWLFVPETMNRSLEEMDQLFDDHTGEEDHTKRAQIRAELEATDYPTSDLARLETD